MPGRDALPPPEASALEDLIDALQVVALYARTFEPALRDTRWADDAAALRRAAERAVRAVLRLQPREPPGSKRG